MKQILYAPAGWHYALYYNSITTSCVFYCFSLFYRFLTCYTPAPRALFFAAGSANVQFFLLSGTRWGGLWYYWVRLYWQYTLFYYTVTLRFRSKYFFIERYAANCFIWWLGYSHVICIYNPQIYFYFLNKHTIIFYSRNQIYLKAVLRQYRALKPLNSYTLRGLRFAKDKIYKRTGKIKRYL